MLSGSAKILKIGQDLTKFKFKFKTVRRLHLQRVTESLKVGTF